MNIGNSKAVIKINGFIVEAISVFVLAIASHQIYLNLVVDTIV